MKSLTNRRVYRTIVFSKWFSKQDFKTQMRINARLQRIEIDGHFGTINVFNGLVELKWSSGLRIYMFLMEQKIIVILLGGNKRGQDKDIKKAKNLKKQIEEDGFDET